MLNKTVTFTFVFLVVVWSSVSKVHATPSISAVSGSVSNGQSITIQGSGFGTKSPAAPVKWDNFESYAANNSMLSGTGFTRIAGGDGVSTPYIRNDQAYGQGTKSARMDYYPNFGSSGSMFPTTGVLLPGSPLDLYMSYRMRWTKTSGSESGSFIYKESRGGAGASYSGIPKFYKTIRPGTSTGEVNWGDMGFVTSNGTTSTTNWTAGNTMNKWDREEWHYKLSNPVDTATGAFEQWTNGVANTSWKAVNTRPSANSNAALSYVMTLFDGLDSYTANYSLWMDDFYLDITQARVEICSGSTWTNKGTCEIQIPTAWDSTGQSATVTINQGAFASNSSQYLYLVDSTGAVNSNGKAITFGASSGTAPIAAPSNLTVVVQP